jgi:pimeloyl-ACP methyl ester carboxylesterase
MAHAAMDGAEQWKLGRRVELAAGEVAYEVFGEGPPVVLVHGTPSRSHIWRDVAPTLAEHHAVYVYDLLGFGDSERKGDQDISIAAQARLLGELIGVWGLEKPAIAGHDIGGGIVLRAHLLEETRFSRIALLDAVVLTPWGTPALRHVKAHIDAYRTMPTAVFEAYVAARLREATHRPFDEVAFSAYLSQWRGPERQEAYLTKDEQLDERHTAEIEPLLGSIGVPVLILWGERDAWLDPAQGNHLRDAIPGSSLKKIPEAGHFVMEDAAGEVVRELASFFGADGQTS